MAQYTIVTTREQEAGLNYSFEHFAAEGQTKQQFLQERINHMVLNPMFVDFKNAQATSLEKSIATIPEANEAKASQEIQTVILANGGVLVPVGPPSFPEIRNIPRGTIPAARGTSGNPIQVGGSTKPDVSTGRPDGGGDF
jgi:hypothetical protein